MKKLLLCTVWLLPAASFAQSPEEALRGRANPHGLELAAPALLYTHLGDTTKPARALHLRPGNARVAIGMAQVQRLSH
jgi:hypothetical protein